MREQEIKNTLRTIDEAISKHRELAAWGNVESKERLRFLRSRKRELKQELSMIKEKGKGVSSWS